LLFLPATVTTSRGGSKIPHKCPSELLEVWIDSCDGNCAPDSTIYCPTDGSDYHDPLNHAPQIEMRRDHHCQRLLDHHGTPCARASPQPPRWRPRGNLKRPICVVVYGV
ncbi:unnamed protein product, partial [Ectocarpus sp. 12 AP-2014]